MIRVLLVNTGSNVMVMLVKLIITFIMTPIFVQNLGKYDYGLWEMVGGIIGYAGMLGFGIRPAVSRFAAKYRAESNREQLLRVYASTFFFMVFVGMLLATISVLWALWYPELLSESGDEAHRYTVFLLIIAVQLLFSFPGHIVESYLEGFQKYYLKNAITIFNSIVGSVVLYSFIEPDNGLLLLAAVNAVGFSLKYLTFMYILSRPQLDCMVVRTSYFSLETLRELINFGLKSLVQGISTRIENATDSLVIGFALGPAMVPFYSIPANLVQNLRTLGWTLSHAFMPLFSDLSARSEQRKIQETYLLASKYVVGIILPLAVGITIVGAPFIGLWIGPEFEENGQWIINFLVVFTVLPLLDPFNSRYLTAINKHGIFAKLAPIAALINLSLSIALVHEFGILGVAFASIVPGFIFVPIYLRYTCQQLGLPVSRYITESLLPCFLPTVLLALSAYGIRVYTGLDSYLAIIGTAIGSGLVWALAFWSLALRDRERRYILERFAKR